MVIFGIARIVLQALFTRHADSPRQKKTARMVAGGFDLTSLPGNIPAARPN
jgi:hypothetical protein